MKSKTEKLLFEFEEESLNVIALAEIKKKNKTEEVSKGHMINLDGDKQQERAKAGVGCIIRKFETNT